MFPTDARLLDRAREIERLAKGAGIKLSILRPSGQVRLIKHQHYTHANQFKRTNRALKTHYRGPPT
jgi:hypothetical protein